MNFKVSIKLGNAGMSTGAQVADALHEIAELLDSDDVVSRLDHGDILDENGNTVGHWEAQ